MNTSRLILPTVQVKEPYAYLNKNTSRLILLRQCTGQRTMRLSNMNTSRLILPSVQVKEPYSNLNMNISRLILLSVQVKESYGYLT